MMHVADDADDFPLLRVALILIGADIGNALANWVFVWKIALCQRFVDDCRSDTNATILFSEVTTLPQRNSDCLKIVRGDATHISERLFSRFRFGVSYDSEVAEHVAAAERHGRDKRGVLDAGQSTEPIERLFHITHALFRILISLSCQTDLSG